jgi:hypothetical protein
MEFINVNTGWVFVNYTGIAAGGIFKTTDGGNSWTQYSHGTADAIASAHMVDANTGFLSLNPSNKPIYKTTNGGANWTACTTPLTGNIKSVWSTDGNLVYISASAGTSRFAKSTDGGATWNTVPLPVPVDVSSIEFKDANTGYICGNSTTVVCRTSNGGATWSFENVHLPTLVKVHVTAGDTAYLCGTYSSILRAPGSSLTAINYNGYVIPDNYQLSQNYPNPFNPSTRIRFALPTSGTVSLKVYDILGHEAAVIVNNMQLNSGTFTYDFNGENLATGIYFYSLYVDNNKVDTKKMVLVK